MTDRLKARRSTFLLSKSQRHLISRQRLWRCRLLHLYPKANEFQNRENTTRIFNAVKLALEYSSLLRVRQTNLDPKLPEQPAALLARRERITSRQQLVTGWLESKHATEPPRK